MAIEPYSPCPCGSGRKLKFCCQAILSEMERVLEFQQNNQPRMALAALDEGRAGVAIGGERLGLAPGAGARRIEDDGVVAIELVGSDRAAVEVADLGVVAALERPRIAGLGCRLAVEVEQHREPIRAPRQPPRPGRGPP